MQFAFDGLLQIQYLNLNIVGLTSCTSIQGTTFSKAFPTSHSSLRLESPNAKPPKLIQSTAACLAMLGPSKMASCQLPCSLANPDQKKRLRSASWRGGLKIQAGKASRFRSGKDAARNQANVPELSYLMSDWAQALESMLPRLWQQGIGAEQLDRRLTRELHDSFKSIKSVQKKWNLLSA